MLCVAVYVFQHIANYYENHIKRKDYDYSLLPPHVIANILTHLNVNELCRAVLTCKSWYYASCDPIVTKNLCLNLWQRETDYVMRPITSLRIQVYEWKKSLYQNFLKKFGANITDVNLYGKISLPRILQTFLHLPNIRTLKINDDLRFHSQGNFERWKILAKYKDEIFQNLTSIQSIDINTSKRNLKGYEQLLSHCPNIVKFRWWDNNNELTEYRCDFLLNFLLEPSKNPTLYKLIDLQLDILDRKQNGKFFEKMVKLELSQLKKLVLSEISSTYYDVMFKEFCRMYNGLDTLSITGCNERQLMDICKYIKNLQIFEIYNCTANNLEEISNLENLEELFLNRTDVVHDDGLSLFLIGNNLSFLKKLTLNKISLTTLNMICENLTNLEDLTLLDVETKECELLYRNMLKLKKLNLQFVDPSETHSSRIKSSHRYNITNLTQLVELNVSCYIPGITPELLKQMPKLPKYIWVHDPRIVHFDWDGNIEDLYNWENTPEIAEEIQQDDNYNIADLFDVMNKSCNNLVYK